MGQSQLTRTAVCTIGDAPPPYDTYCCFLPYSAPTLDVCTVQKSTAEVPFNFGLTWSVYMVKLGKPVPFFICGQAPIQLINVRVKDDRCNSKHMPVSP